MILMWSLALRPYRSPSDVIYAPLLALLSSRQHHLHRHSTCSIPHSRSPTSFTSWIGPRRLHRRPQTRSLQGQGLNPPSTRTVVEAQSWSQPAAGMLWDWEKWYWDQGGTQVMLMWKRWSMMI